VLAWMSARDSLGALLCDLCQPSFRGSPEGGDGSTSRA
jgi:hypothetical protein